jgi:hypothetical protein
VQKYIERRSDTGFSYEIQIMGAGGYASPAFISRL